MADGRTHAAANAGLLTFITIGGAVAVYTQPDTVTASLAAGAILGAAGGLLITPDIDQTAVTHEERRLIRVLGPLGYLWTLFWLPYGIAFAHRGMSHTIPQGTLSRVLYVGIPVFLLAWASGLRPDAASVQYMLYGCGTFLAAWFLQDLSHLMLDGLWPGRAPWRKPRWQPRSEKGF